ncbi:EAL domain-containing protein [Vibrio sp. RE86]|uniref:bifunctional diguanylate cyclase/phosphodiesterase n=1 Tax=Vibrio sp. RE86 TaxID=2607605 RepID=UPI001493951E|nr:EAL domain-containing protein [Vibrio sp. RE86]NOH79969.1 EAL domain-containing protein [Vibrio sp. RE86]
MNNRPKTIWTLHKAVVAISVLLLVFIIRNIWLSTVEGTIRTQTTQVELFSNSLVSLLTNEAKILDVAGKQALRNIENNEPIQTTIKMFDALISDYGDISAIRLMDKNGFSLASSSNLKSLAYLDQLRTPRLWANFVETLSSEQLVIGRTYYSQNLKSDFIPFRKAIRDKNNEPVAVITGAVSLNNTGLINDSLLLGEHNTFEVVRDDGYPQIILPPTAGSYEQKVDFTNHSELAKSLNQVANIDSLMLTGKTQSFYINHLSDVFVGVTQYIPGHGLWVVSKVNQNHIFTQFLPSFVTIMLVFCGLQWFIFVLIKRIHESDRSRRKELHYQANHDFLTGLPNRYFLQRKKHQWKNKAFALLYIDLDKFKVLNDTYGHSNGDKLLVELAKRINKMKPKGSLFAREAGDEFLLICEQDSVSNIEQYCQELLSKISQPYQLETTQYVLTASIGVSLYPQHSDNIDTIKSLADIAALKAKGNRDTYCVFTPEMANEYQMEAKIEQRLRVALNNDGLHIDFQPQYQDGVIWGMEALARWHDEELGIVNPERFISVAESSGLMPQLGKVLLRRSLQESKKIQIQTHRKLQTSINISVIQFMDVDFISQLTKTTKEFGLEPSSVTLELTESVLITNISAVMSKCKALKKIGFELSLDDFGTGYSSLHMLHRLPVDELKVDRAFIRNLLEDDKCYALVKSILSIGRSLGVRVVAEGVEEKDQVHAISLLGAHIMQGYYYNKPLSVETLIAQLKKKAA